MFGYGLASLQVSEEVREREVCMAGFGFRVSQLVQPLPLLSSPGPQLFTHAQSAYNQVGAAIDAKTATPDKPGLFTQVSSAVQKGVAQIEKAVITVSPELPRWIPFRDTAKWKKTGIQSYEHETRGVPTRCSPTVHGF